MQKKIKPSFKKVTNEERASFNKANCLLNISVGQASQEDQRFAATMELISQTFASCTITLNDTLQRHTMALAYQDKEPKELRKKALTLGGLWLERNSQFINKLANPPKIIRWDEWLAHKDYQACKTQVTKTLECDASYRAAFKNSINEFLNRYTNRLKNKSNFDKKRAEELCMDYLIEECAAMCLWPETGCHFELYAGTHNKAIESTRKRFITPRYPDLIRSVKIGFNHRPDLAHQQLGMRDNA